MNRKNIYFILATMVIASMAFFIVRQRSLKELQSDNETLQRQIEAPGGGAGSEAVTEIPSTNSAVALSVDEKAELLRLRAQVQSLRSDATEASNRVVGLNRPPVRTAARGGNPSAELDQSRNAFIEFTRTPAYRNADQLAKALQQYLLQHAGQVPLDLAVLESPGNATLAEGTIQRFELVRTGTIVENPDLAPYVLIAHEKEPIQLPDGKWVRFYLQANGGLTIAGPLPNKPPLDDSDFIRHMEEFGKQKVQPK